MPDSHAKEDSTVFLSELDSIGISFLDADERRIRRLKKMPIYLVPQPAYDLTTY